MANRRQVERTRTITTEHKVKFTAEELRKRLRLPEEAELRVDVTEADLPELDGIVATWTTTATKEA